MNIDRLAIIGGSGFIGSEVVKNFKGKYEVLDPDQDELDIRKAAEVEEWIKNSKADVIFLLAAYTDVKGAQENPDLAREINVNGVRNVAVAAKKYGKHVVYMSTGFVFTGRSDYPGPYSENDDPRKCNPQDRGVYAETKLEGEEVLQKVMGDDNYTIIRIDFPFGNENFLQKDYLLKLLNQAKTIPLFDDQQITPTYIPDLIYVLEFIAEKRPVGIFHVATPDLTSPYRFALEASQLLRIPLEIRKSSVFDYLDEQTKNNKKVLWSLIGGLRVEKIEKLVGRKMRTSSEALKDFAPRVKDVLK
jgi:dTDP-4-dehydrorhamnose reductase